MANGVCETVSSFQTCTLQGTRNYQQKKLRLFSALGCIKFVAMDILGPLPETEPGKRHVIVLTDPYTKLERTIVATTVALTNIATVFVDNRVISYLIPTIFVDQQPSEICIEVL